MNGSVTSTVLLCFASFHKKTVSRNAILDGRLVQTYFWCVELCLFGVLWKYEDAGREMEAGRHGGLGCCFGSCAQ